MMTIRIQLPYSQKSLLGRKMMTVIYLADVCLHMKYSPVDRDDDSYNSRFYVSNEILISTDKCFEFSYLYDNVHSYMMMSVDLEGVHL